MEIPIRWKDLDPECQARIEPYLAEDTDEEEIIFNLIMPDVGALLDQMPEELSEGVPKNTEPVDHE